MNDSSLNFVPTKGSSVKPNAEQQFQIVSYKAHKKKPNDKIPENPVNSKHKDKDAKKELNIRKAKHEVVKLGMSALDPEKKEEAKVQLAISLGAKPPKNKYKNYKQLLEEKRKEKERVKERNSLSQIGKNKLGMCTAKGKSYDRKRKKGKIDILGVYGTVKKPDKRK